MYSPIVHIDISPMYYGNISSSSVVTTIRELTKRNCRVILTCMLAVPPERVRSFIESYKLDISAYNDNLTCIKNALGNLISNAWDIHCDYKFSLQSDNTKSINEACNIDNFYIKLYTFEDGSHIGFKHGNFDNWCIDFHDVSGKVINPRDEYYFGHLLEIATKRNCHSYIYEDFIDIYNVTTERYNSRIMDIIVDMSRKYGDYATMFRNCMAMIYLGMIAEENKENAILKRRVKRLGMYQVFVERMNVEEAARFSAGMKWYDLDKVMREKGI